MDCKGIHVLGTIDKPCVPYHTSLSIVAIPSNTRQPDPST